jgi:hypothetical protein
LHLSSYFIVAFTFTFICVCVFIIIFTFIFTFIFLGVFVFAFILYSYSYSYLHYHICIHVYIRIYSHTSVHVFVHDYIHICIQFTFTLICKFTLTFYSMPSSTSSTFSTFSSALVSQKEADGVSTCREYNHRPHLRGLHDSRNLPFHVNSVPMLSTNTATRGTHLAYLGPLPVTQQRTQS